VLGVSTDSVKKHQKFKQKYDLPFTLIADTDHHIAEQYGVWGEKTLFGRKYMGITRTTFVIDAKGRIARILSKLEPEEHAREAEAVLAELTA
jgi:peroxiredoxin Q/BCP